MDAARQNRTVPTKEYFMMEEMDANDGNFAGQSCPFSTMSIALGTDRG
jgi:hypothetical protein